MSDNCAASSIELFRFDSIWHVDFEYREDANHRPLPICMFAREQRSGQEIFLWRDQLLTLARAPFGTGERDLMVAYTANAELSCFLVLGWPFPRRVLDLYVETIAAINGRSDVWLQEKRPGILEALELFGLPAFAAEWKAQMRDLILAHTDYSNEQRQQIEAYNRSDVDSGTVPLLTAMAANIDLPRALHRGRFMAAVACQEHTGLPIDRERLACLGENWEPLRYHYIAQDDDLGLYEDGHFREQRMAELIAAKGWDWPRSQKTGRPELKRATLGQQARRYPELRKLVHLRETIAELRIGKLLATVGADGFSRCPLLPFWTVTGRNQPAARDKVFLPSLPTWLRGLLRPPPGWVLLELDFKAQEVAIVAARSGDPGMLADYRSGDPYWGFGVRAGLVATDADANAHKEFRDKVLKPLVLGQYYGMTPHGIAHKTGRSLLWARAIHSRQRTLSPVFYRWRGDMVAQAKFDRLITSPFGWPMAVDGKTTDRTLMNFPAQAGGADVMRIAAIAATEAGIKVCCSVHDAFWILAPLEDVVRATDTMREIMRAAGAAVTGGLPIEVEVKTEVRAARNLGDCWARHERGYAMWHEVTELLAGKLRRRAEA